MKTTTLVVAILSANILTGCAGALAPVGDFFDRQDPCQFKGKQPNYQLPNFCGAASGHTVQITRGAYNGTYLVNTK